MQPGESVDEFMDRYDKWWVKWHQTLVSGAILGIILDAVSLYFLFTSDLMTSVFIGWLLGPCIGALIGFSVVLFMAANPNLRRKTVRNIVARYSNKSN